MEFKHIRDIQYDFMAKSDDTGIPLVNFYRLSSQWLWALPKLCVCVCANTLGNVTWNSRHVFRVFLSIRLNSQVHYPAAQRNSRTYSVFLLSRFSTFLDFSLMSSGRLFSKLKMTFTFKFLQMFHRGPSKHPVQCTPWMCKCNSFFFFQVEEIFYKFDFVFTYGEKHFCNFPREMTFIHRPKGGI